ncbi:oxidoreductase [Tumebacillus permanentifrigoris]|uniref:Scyllo-inositol 2-dehydrogenase (NADP+) n=1 Tax=Tumebacillus permanentifrigoris TaxID=378543 RepID=A0A316DAV5_9BACL|nr:oxidoreductase [Tumebacillus permanentifrigoris]PWK14439.1 scyllo-inositol 2-dehydrogenase (NADP+) [Tumebacillus permanentifrigoris]
MTIQVGLVGYGLSGSVFHAPILQAVENLHLSTVVSSKPDTVLQDLPDVRVVPTLQDLLDDDEIGLVVITSPNTTHYEYARDAILAGKHVIVEKPFVVTSEEGDALVKLAREQGVLLSVYHNRRFDNDFLTVQELLQTGLLGELLSYEAHFDRWRPQVQVRWREQDVPGSGTLYDLGSHLIDQALVLFGTPRTVFADLKIQREHAETIDSFHVVLNYDRLRVTLRASALVREAGPRYILHGTKGSFRKFGIDSQENALRAGQAPGDAGWGEDRPEWYGTITTDVGGLTVEGRIPTLRGRYESYYEQVASAILTGSALPVTAAEARDTIRVIELAMQSHATGQAMAFN